jgi:hypothetical protein
MRASRLLARRLEELRERRYRAHGDNPDFSRLADLFLTSNVRARKTAENPEVTVLFLEAGGSDDVPEVINPSRSVAMSMCVASSSILCGTATSTRFTAPNGLSLPC